jgi:SAM-dependent methyltransferase
MEGFDPGTSFGERTSKRYDADSVRGDEDETVAFLAALASGGGGRALELAVGTGRIALPLAAAGAEVDGIEQSAAMVERLREKPGGADIDVTMGDMSRATTGRTYGLVYLVFNTIGNLVTQDDQVRCFENAARHLADDGVFVLECRVPTAPARAGADGQFVDAEIVEADRVVLGVGQYDPLSQVMSLNHVEIGEDGIVLNPIALRLAHPPEFDLMARIAGLRLDQRYGGWDREPFTATSWRHISLYRPSPDRRPSPDHRHRSSDDRS